MAFSPSQKSIAWLNGEPIKSVWASMAVVPVADFYFVPANLTNPLQTILISL